MHRHDERSAVTQCAQVEQVKQRSGVTQCAQVQRARDTKQIVLRKRFEQGQQTADVHVAIHSKCRRRGAVRLAEKAWSGR